MTIKLKTFSGTSKVFDAGPDGLAATLRGLAQNLARHAASAAGSFTDNSGGSASTTVMEAVAAFTPFTETGTASWQKAEGDAAMVDVIDAIATVAGNLTAIEAKVPATSVTDNTGGTDGNDTIAAIDLAYTAVSSSITEVVQANANLVLIKNAMSTLCVLVNKMAVACGIDPLTDNSGGTPSYDSTLAALVSSSGTAVDGTALSGIASADADTQLTAVANNVASLAAKLDECTDATAGFMVANVIAE